MGYGGNTALETISPDGVVPETRMKSARDTQDFARRLIDNDCRRSFKRSRVNGLVDGNPPFKLSKLRDAGRADACNVNWGTGRSYLESGAGSFYDLATEAPSVITFRTAHGSPEEKETWSNIVSGEADRIFAMDDLWDYEEQISQWNMVLHGCGPLFFENTYNVFPRAVQCGDLKVPEFTKSDTSYWEAATLEVFYYPPELYAFIRDREAARKIGWNPSYTEMVIANAMDIRQQRGIQYDWEFFQQELKNNSLSYMGEESKVCRMVHAFWKEFDGRITQGVIERDSNPGGTASAMTQDYRSTLNSAGVQYCFIHVGRYESFKQCVHPMYYDRGNGGFHHSVTGLGVKMFAAMEYQNRLICNLCDKAFSPKLLFNPSTTEAQQKFQLARFGDYAVLPVGTTVSQNPMAGLMNDGVGMKELLDQVMQETLSSYKGGAPSQKSGNPVTKFEKQLEAAMASAMSKTQFNRYYKQRDQLMSEIMRRLCNPNTTDDRAKDFQKRCKAKGVPQEALNRWDYVGATRVVGQGSAFMRKQAIDSIFPIASSLPEEGRDNLIADKIAAEAGQSAVSRYYPKKAQPMPTDQVADAKLQVVQMKVGMPATVTSSQSAVTYAGIYLKAGMDAVQSISKGGDPHEVFAFLNLVGPALMQQIQRFAHDPTRQKEAKAMTQGWKKLAEVTDKLKKELQKQAEQQKQQQQKTQGAMTDEQLKVQKLKTDMGIKSAKAKAQMQQSQEKHALKIRQGVQSMALEDAKTAHGLNLNRLRSFSDNGDN
jgi:hypothetical protein